jgi:hypothetical protein
VLPDTNPSIINFVIKTIRERNKWKKLWYYLI